MPSVGANLVRLAHTGLGVEILRTPDANETDTFRRRPHVFGLPILFPPNRIADGSYSFDGRTYRFPITIEREHNYHHGLLKSQPFAVSKARETDDEVLMECRYYSNAGNDAIFRDFPHEFRCKIVYRLTANGLEQEVVFTNRSRNQMPVGIGFHTPLRIPFAGGTDADYVMRVAVGEQVELDGRNLPTGRKLPLTEEFARLRTSGLRVTGCGPIEAGSPFARSTWTAERSAAHWSSTSARVSARFTRWTKPRPIGRSGTTADRCITAVRSPSPGRPTPPMLPTPKPPVSVRSRPGKNSP